VANYDKWDYHQQGEAWMNVGKAQRDVPAHVAHEYCRPYRSFASRPSFTEKTLKRTLTLINYYVTNINSWFPLSSSSSGLGFDFALMRDNWQSAYVTMDRGEVTQSRVDLAAVRRLDEVRIADLTQSRENLSRPERQSGLVH
jgi:hypothetical protein